MPKPKIVVVYKVKNESRFIEQSLKSVIDICSDIVVLDNNSSDDTVEICSGFDKVDIIEEKRDLPYDEVREKNIILQ